MSGDKYRSIDTECPRCGARLSFDVVARPETFPLTILADGSRGVADLSIVCVSSLSENVIPNLIQMHKDAIRLNAEFLLCPDIRDGYEKINQAAQLSPLVMPVTTKGYVESVLNDVLQAASGTWILRLDDDEEMSRSLIRWLEQRKYLSHHCWSFPTATLFWEDSDYFITHPLFWPDFHVRLVTWKYASWPNRIHAPSPVMGTEAPVSLIHKKLTLFSSEERRQKAKRYEKRQLGSGTGHRLIAQVPEECLEEITVLEIGDGYFPDPRRLIGSGKSIRFKEGTAQ